MKRQILSILLTFVMVFNLTTFASATSVSNEGSANTDISTLSAGLAWGPVIVGNIQFTMSKPRRKLQITTCLKASIKRAANVSLHGIV